VQALGGAAEVKLFGDGHEVAKVTEFDFWIHIHYVLIIQNKILDILHLNKETGPGGRIMAQTTVEKGAGKMEWSGRLEIEFRPLEIGQDGTAFRTLNEEWISRYFVLEPKDRETLGDPENTILRKGGRIFMVWAGGEAVGCVALIPMGDGVYELSKMAVSPAMRGQGIGRRLLEHAIEQAKALGAASLFLGSNSVLKSAVHLYEAVGFSHVPPEKLPDMHYARADVFMEMVL
jgi:GNAT superfamily N-acetyltransferase